MTSEATTRINEIRCPETGEMIDVSDLTPQEALFTAFVVSTPQEEYNGADEHACFIPWFVHAQMEGGPRGIMTHEEIDVVSYASGVEWYIVSDIFDGVAGTRNDMAYGLAVAARNLDIPLRRAQELVSTHDGDIQLQEEHYVIDSTHRYDDE